MTEQPRWHAMLITLVILLVPTLFAPEAKADTNLPKSEQRVSARSNNLHQCHRNLASTRQDTWAEDTVYLIQIGARPGENFRMRQTAGLRYWFCPNNPRGPLDYTNLIMPLKILYCVTPYSAPWYGYNGVTMNANIYTPDGVDTNPKPKKVPRSTGQICRWQKIKPAKREWMLMSMDPRYTVHNTINLIMYPDFDHYFWWKTGDVWHKQKPVVPGNDAIINPLHPIPHVR